MLFTADFLFPMGSEFKRAEGKESTKIAGYNDNPITSSTLHNGIPLQDKALEFIEANGFIHRNITPGHILIRKSDGTAKLNGLMLAKTLDDSQGMLTQAGDIVGELPFLSPEQIGSGELVDHRSDIYQLGAAMYALLTGRPPFEGGNMTEIIPQILTQAPVPPTDFHLAIPALLEGTVITMLAKRPRDRFATASELLLNLKRANRYLASS